MAIDRINQQQVTVNPRVVLQPDSEDIYLFDPRYITTRNGITTEYGDSLGLDGGGGGGDTGDPGNDGFRPELDDIISYVSERKLAPGGATVVTLKIKLRNSSGKVIKGFDAKVPQ